MLILSFPLLFYGVVGIIVNVAVDVGCWLLVTWIAVAMLSNLMKYFAAYSTAECPGRLPFAIVHLSIAGLSAQAQAQAHAQRF